MKIGKFTILGISIMITTVLLMGCSFVKSNKEVEIDWDTVNKALAEGGYQANSVEEAEEIVGYTIPTIKPLPQGFEEEPTGILILKTNPLKEDSPLNVWLTWGHENGAKSGFFTLDLIANAQPIEIDTSSDSEFEITEINGTEVYLKVAKAICELYWYNEDINYHLYGMLTDTLTEDIYIDMAETIIE